ncbi:transposase [Cytobacillus sp. S13-E01]|uniref:transposase n=1 Tax=Cytobacillus sp. S13-E01 TaxID=3031326 RepID=UPI0023D82C09|nr:transposase [Cytobacillus sp. S13-E01]MDF0726833.1 transposase [Cytobacillus sp. S13-E01]
MGKKNVYTKEIKWAVVKDKLEGKLTTKEIMEKHNIKNVSQIKTWMKLYKNGEMYRFDQPIGKQYTFGHGPESLSKDERINNQLTHLKMENEILKKYLAMRKESIKG